MERLSLEKNHIWATIALLAHESQISNLLKLAQKYDSILCRYRLVAPSQTARQFPEKINLSIQSLEINQLETEIDSDNVLAVIFLIDPTLSTPSIPDVTDLSRICIILLRLQNIRSSVKQQQKTMFLER